MKYDKTTIVGVAVCAVILVCWGPLMRNLGLAPTGQPRKTTLPATASPAREETRSGQSAAGKAGAAATSAQENTGPLQTEPDGSAPPVAPPAGIPRASVPKTSAGTVGAPSPDADSLPFRQPDLKLPQAVHRLTVEGFMDLTIDPKGTGISAVSLGRYRSDDRTEAVSLGRYQQPLCAVMMDQTPWTQTGEAEVLEATDATLVVRHQLNGGNLALTQTWKVLPDSPYQLSYRVSIRNQSDAPVSVPRLPVSCGALPANPQGAAKGGSKRMAAMNAGIDVAFVGEDRPKGFSLKKLSKLQRGDSAAGLSQQAAKWVAVHTKYFLFYVASDAGAFPGVAVGATADGEPQKPNPWLYAGVLLEGVSLEPDQDHEWELSCYAGPKQYELLKGIDKGLLSVMRMDLFFGLHPRWMAWISGRILTALITLNSFFNHRWGYGFAIIVITFVIKMLFWPLTHRSTASMRKMQKIQPLVKELREKYGGQPEKMNRKVMELYKEHNVSPLGGCLPMFLQIPVFFALFNTFRSAIELRQASFLWVADLSIPDTIADPFGLPIRPLAILMAVSMLGQQKMMPSSADPSQARMMMFMSVFFMFIFYSMPAGLTLYWTVNQILTIMQTLVSRKLEKQTES